MSNILWREGNGEWKSAYNENHDELGRFSESDSSGSPEEKTTSPRANKIDIISSKTPNLTSTISIDNFNIKMENMVSNDLDKYKISDELREPIMAPLRGDTNPDNSIGSTTVKKAWDEAIKEHPELKESRQKIEEYEKQVNESIQSIYDKSTSLFRGTTNSQMDDIIKTNMVEPYKYQFISLTLDKKTADNFASYNSATDAITIEFDKKAIQNQKLWNDEPMIIQPVKYSAFTSNVGEEELEREYPISFSDQMEVRSYQFKAQETIKSITIHQTEYMDKGEAEKLQDKYTKAFPNAQIYINKKSISKSAILWKNGDEDGFWFTTDTGAHVHVEPGQSKEEALKQHFDKIKTSPKIKDQKIKSPDERIEDFVIKNMDTFKNNSSNIFKNKNQHEVIQMFDHNFQVKADMITEEKGETLTKKNLFESVSDKNNVFWSSMLKGLSMIDKKEISDAEFDRINVPKEIEIKAPEILIEKNIGNPTSEDRLLVDKHKQELLNESTKRMTALKNQLNDYKQQYKKISDSIENHGGMTDIEVNKKKWKEPIFDYNSRLLLQQYEMYGYRNLGHDLPTKSGFVSWFNQEINENPETYKGINKNDIDKFYDLAKTHVLVENKENAVKRAEKSPLLDPNNKWMADHEVYQPLVTKNIHLYADNGTPDIVLKYTVDHLKEINFKRDEGINIQLHTGEAPVTSDFILSGKSSHEGGHWDAKKNEVVVWNTENGLYNIKYVLPHELAHVQFESLVPSDKNTWHSEVDKLDTEARSSVVEYPKIITGYADSYLTEDDSTNSKISNRDTEVYAEIAHLQYTSPEEQTSMIRPKDQLGDSELGKFVEEYKNTHPSYDINKPKYEILKEEHPKLIEIFERNRGLTGIQAPHIKYDKFEDLPKDLLEKVMNHRVKT